MRKVRERPSRRARANRQLYAEEGSTGFALRIRAMRSTHKRRVESDIVDSGLGDVDGPLTARPKSERFELMRRFYREKSGDETVPVAMRPRNDSTPL